MRRREVLGAALAAAGALARQAPMPTPPRAAAALGDRIHVAGGAVLGVGMRSAVHEAFALA